jgi:hypothetical protein
MNISEVIENARLAGQRAEETPSDPQLAYDAARSWEQVADTANALADTWKHKGGARAVLRHHKTLAEEVAENKLIEPPPGTRRYSADGSSFLVVADKCHECDILLVDGSCPDCGNTY